MDDIKLKNKLKEIHNAVGGDVYVSYEALLEFFKKSKEYLKNNLKLAWNYQGNKLYLTLSLEGEIISKIKFEQY